MIKALINFFTNASGLQNFVESKNPQNIQEVEILCKLWVESHQNKLV
jgi:hypothetical protein